MFTSLHSSHPVHEVLWQGPKEKPSVHQDPPAPVKTFQAPVQAQALHFEQIPNLEEALSQHVPKANLPAWNRDEPWSLQQRGLITAPMAVLNDLIEKDPRWQVISDQHLYRQDADATFAVIEVEDGRIVAMSLTFGERGASAIMPEIEMILLGSEISSPILWDLAPSARDRLAGGLLTQASLQEGSEARRVYYFCDYGDVSLNLAHPKSCIFSFNITKEAWSLGAHLKPARTR